MSEKEFGYNSKDHKAVNKRLDKLNGSVAKHEEYIYEQKSLDIIDKVKKLWELRLKGAVIFALIVFIASFILPRVVNAIIDRL